MKEIYHNNAEYLVSLYGDVPSRGAILGMCVLPNGCILISQIGCLINVIIPWGKGVVPLNLPKRVRSVRGMTRIKGSSEILLSDPKSHCIWTMQSNGSECKVAAGTPGCAGSSSSVDLLKNPYWAGISPTQEHIAVCDTGNNCIKISLHVDNQKFTSYGSHVLNKPTHCAWYNEHSLVVSDSGNHCIRALQYSTTDDSWTMFNLAGVPGHAGNQNGSAECSLFNSPTGVTVASSGAIIISDRNNYCLRYVASGVVGTLTGSKLGVRGTRNGSLEESRYGIITGAVSLGVNDTIFVADSGNRNIRCIKKKSVQLPTAIHPPTDAVIGKHPSAERFQPAFFEAKPETPPVTVEKKQRQPLHKKPQLPLDARGVPQPESISSSGSESEVKTTVRLKPAVPRQQTAKKSMLTDIQNSSQATEQLRNIFKRFSVIDSKGRQVMPCTKWIRLLSESKIISSNGLSTAQVDIIYSSVVRSDVGMPFELFCKAIAHIGRQLQPPCSAAEVTWCYILPFCASSNVSEQFSQPGSLIDSKVLALISINELMLLKIFKFFVEKYTGSGCIPFSLRGEGFGEGVRSRLLSAQGWLSFLRRYEILPGLLTRAACEKIAVNSMGGILLTSLAGIEKQPLSTIRQSVMLSFPEFLEALCRTAFEIYAELDSPSARLASLLQAMNNVQVQSDPVHLCVSGLVFQVPQVAPAAFEKVPVSVTDSSNDTLIDSPIIGLSIKKMSDPGIVPGSQTPLEAALAKAGKVEGVLDGIYTPQSRQRTSSARGSLTPRVHRMSIEAIKARRQLDFSQATENSTKKTPKTRKPIVNKEKLQFVPNTIDSNMIPVDKFDSVLRTLKNKRVKSDTSQPLTKPIDLSSSKSNSDILPNSVASRRILDAQLKPVLKTSIVGSVVDFKPRETSLTNKSVEGESARFVPKSVVTSIGEIKCETRTREVEAAVPDKGDFSNVGNPGDINQVKTLQANTFSPDILEDLSQAATPIKKLLSPCSGTDDPFSNSFFDSPHVDTNERDGDMSDSIGIIVDSSSDGSRELKLTGDTKATETQLFNINIPKAISDNSRLLGVTQSSDESDNTIDKDVSCVEKSNDQLIMQQKTLNSNSPLSISSQQVSNLQNCSSTASSLASSFSSQEAPSKAGTPLGTAAINSFSASNDHRSPNANNMSFSSKTGSPLSNGGKLCDHSPTTFSSSSSRNSHSKDNPFGSDTNKSNSPSQAADKDLSFSSQKSSPKASSPIGSDDYSPTADDNSSQNLPSESKDCDVNKLHNYSPVSDGGLGFSSQDILFIKSPNVSDGFGNQKGGQEGGSPFGSKSSEYCFDASPATPLASEDVINQFDGFEKLGSESPPNDPSLISGTAEVIPLSSDKDNSLMRTNIIFPVENTPSSSPRSEVVDSNSEKSTNCVDPLLESGLKTEGVTKSVSDQFIVSETLPTGVDNITGDIIVVSDSDPFETVSAPLEVNQAVESFKDPLPDFMSPIGTPSSSPASDEHEQHIESPKDVVSPGDVKTAVDPFSDMLMGLTPQKPEAVDTIIIGGNPESGADLFPDSTSESVAASKPTTLTPSSSPASDEHDQHIESPKDVVSPGDVKTAVDPFSDMLMGLTPQKPEAVDTIIIGDNPESGADLFPDSTSPVAESVAASKPTTLTPSSSSASDEHEQHIESPKDVVSPGDVKTAVDPFSDMLMGLTPQKPEAVDTIIIGDNPESGADLFPDSTSESVAASKPTTLTPSSSPASDEHDQHIESPKDVVSPGDVKTAVDPFSDMLMGLTPQKPEAVDTIIIGGNPESGADLFPDSTSESVAASKPTTLTPSSSPASDEHDQHIESPKDVVSPGDVKTAVDPFSDMLMGLTPQKPEAVDTIIIGDNPESGADLFPDSTSPVAESVAASKPTTLTPSSSSASDEHEQHIESPKDVVSPGDVKTAVDPFSDMLMGLTPQKPEAVDTIIIGDNPESGADLFPDSTSESVAASKPTTLTPSSSPASDEHDQHIESPKDVVSPGDVKTAVDPFSDMLMGLTPQKPEAVDTIIIGGNPESGADLFPDSTSESVAASKPTTLTPSSSPASDEHEQHIESPKDVVSPGDVKTAVDPFSDMLMGLTPQKPEAVDTIIIGDNPESGADLFPDSTSSPKDNMSTKDVFSDSTITVTKATSTSLASYGSREFDEQSELLRKSDSSQVETTTIINPSGLSAKAEKDPFSDFTDSTQSPRHLAGQSATALSDFTGTVSPSPKYPSTEQQQSAIGLLEPFETQTDDKDSLPSPSGIAPVNEAEHLCGVGSSLIRNDLPEDSTSSSPSVPSSGKVVPADEKENLPEIVNPSSVPKSEHEDPQCDSSPLGFTSSLDRETASPDSNGNSVKFSEVNINSKVATETEQHSIYPLSPVPVDGLLESFLLGDNSQSPESTREISPTIQLLPSDVVETDTVQPTVSKSSLDRSPSPQGNYSPQGIHSSVVSLGSEATCSPTAEGSPTRQQVGSKSPATPPSVEEIIFSPDSEATASSSKQSPIPIELYSPDSDVSQSSESEVSPVKRVQVKQRVAPLPPPLDDQISTSVSSCSATPRGSQKPKNHKEDKTSSLSPSHSPATPLSVTSSSSGSFHEQTLSSDGSKSKCSSEIDTTSSSLTLPTSLSDSE